MTYKPITILNVLAGISIALSLVMLYDTLSGPDTMEGREALSFPVSSLDLTERKTFRPLAHSTITLFVFKVGCLYCEESVPLWNTLVADENHIRYGEVMGVSISSQTATLNFIIKNKVKFPVMLVGFEFMEAYRVGGTPTTITIHNGIIKRMVSGKPDTSDMSYLINTHIRSQI